MEVRKSLLSKLGKNIRALREAMGLSQESLALKAELDRSYIGGVKRGERNISLINLCRIAKALGVTPSRLLNGIAYETQEE